MSRDAVLLLLQARVVDDHGDTERHHEQHRQRQQAGNQGAHQRQGQGAVEPDQFWAASVGELRHADFAVVDLVALQVQFTQARTFALAVHVGNHQDRHHTGGHGRDHRYEDVRRVYMQRTGGARGRAAPGVMFITPPARMIRPAMIRGLMPMRWYSGSMAATQIM